MKHIKTFEELGFNDPSFKKIDTFGDGQFPKNLSLDESDMIAIDKLSKELDFIYSKMDKKILITCYTENFGKQILIWKNNPDDEMYLLSDFSEDYEVDGIDSLVHLIEKSLEKFPAAKHIQFTIPELKELKDLSVNLRAEFKKFNKVSIFSKRMNTRLVIWKVGDNSYSLGFSQQVYNVSSFEELKQKISEYIG